MKYVVSLTDCADSIYEIFDFVKDDMATRGIFEKEYDDLGKHRVKRLLSMCLTIYLTICALRNVEDVDEESYDIIVRHTLHMINQDFVRMQDGSPHYTYPIDVYLEKNDISCATLIDDIVQAIDESFVTTQAFDSEAYNELVSYFMDIPDEPYLYDFVRACHFRYYIGTDRNYRINGMMTVIADETD